MTGPNCNPETQTAPDPAPQPQRPKTEEEARQRLQELSRRALERHQKRAAEIEGELLNDGKGLGADYRLLARLCAQEAAISERLVALEVDLVWRAEALVETPAHVGTLAATLRQVTQVNQVIGERVQSLLAAAGVARQRRDAAAPRSHLRAVS